MVLCRINKNYSKLSPDILSYLELCEFMFSGTKVSNVTISDILTGVLFVLSSIFWGI